MTNDDFVRKYLDFPYVSTYKEAECIHACNSLSFQGNALYSYRRVIAIKIKEKGTEYLLADAEGYYSNTTCRHIGLLKRHAWRKYSDDKIVNVSNLDEYVPDYNRVKQFDKPAYMSAMNDRVARMAQSDPISFCDQYNRQSVISLHQRLLNVVPLIPEMINNVAALETTMELFNTDEKLASLRNKKEAQIRARKEQNTKICMDLIASSDNIVFDLMLGNNYFNRVRGNIAGGEKVTEVGKAILNMPYEDTLVLFKQIGYNINFSGGGLPQLADMIVSCQEMNPDHIRGVKHTLAMKIKVLNQYYTEDGFNFPAVVNAGPGNYDIYDDTTLEQYHSGYIFRYHARYQTEFKCPNALLDLLHLFIKKLRDLKCFDD